MVISEKIEENQYRGQRDDPHGSNPGAGSHQYFLS